MKTYYKFRGLKKDKSGWIYGMPTHDFTHIFNDNQTDSPDNYEVIPETVGIFTGFLDKNEKEIYHGDLVKRGSSQFHVVIFRQGRLVLKFRDINPFIHFDKNHIYEVIGNFYQNTEMALEYALLKYKNTACN